MDSHPVEFNAELGLTVVRGQEGMQQYLRHLQQAAPVKAEKKPSMLGRGLFGRAQVAEEASIIDWVLYENGEHKAYYAFNRNPKNQLQSVWCCDPFLAQSSTPYGGKAVIQEAMPTVVFHDVTKDQLDMFHLHRKPPVVPRHDVVSGLAEAKRQIYDAQQPHKAAMSQPR